MPSSEQILAGLTRIADDALPLAVVWHAITLAAVVALALGWRPSKRAAGVLVVTPVVSVGVLAFAYHNLFNAAMFATLAIALLAVVRRLDPGSVRLGPSWSTYDGIGMIAFGSLYPHFVQSKSTILHLIASPTGLVPCPTLALVIGFSLLADGFDSRLWMVIVAAFGLFYGLFGAARLGVYLDVGLIAGALALVVRALEREQARHALGGVA